eukprot:2573450-Karenia_brevis.AAC.1
MLVIAVQGNQKGDSGLRLLTLFPVRPEYALHWAENSVLLDLCDPYRTFALGPPLSELSWPPWELLGDARRLTRDARPA